MSSFSPDQEIVFDRQRQLEEVASFLWIVYLPIVVKRLVRTTATTAVVVILVSVSVLAQIKLEKVKVGENIAIKVPREFIPMSDNDSRQRVASFRKPLALYTDMNRSAEFGINRSYSRFVEGDYQMMYNVYKAGILQLYDEVHFEKEEITVIRKQPFVVFEFTGIVKGDETSLSKRNNLDKYVYIQYTLFDGDTYVFNFSSNGWEKDKWQGVAGEIMSSVVMK